MTDRISVEDLTEALDLVARYRWQLRDASRIALAPVLAAARLLVDNPAVLEALQDGSVDWPAFPTDADIEIGSKAEWEANDEAEPWPSEKPYYRAIQDEVRIGVRAVLDAVWSNRRDPVSVITRGQETE